jgi:hypothetical protein
MRSATRPFAGGDGGAQEGLVAKDALESIHRISGLFDPNGSRIDAEKR